jgi:hypothetical protein
LCFPDPLLGTPLHARGEAARPVRTADFSYSPVSG